jgi:flagellin-like protein
MFKTENRGQIGIGTLIIFIAMIIVAAIASGVLIETASQLQEQSQRTGDDTIREVSDRVEPERIIAESSSSSTKIDKLNVTHKPVAGTESVDLRNATWVIQTDKNSTTVNYDQISTHATSGDGIYNVTDISQNAVLDEESSTVKVQFNLDDPTTSSDDKIKGIRSLDDNDEVTIIVGSPAGGEMRISDKTPRYIDDSETSYIL